MNCPQCGASLRLEEGKDYLTCDYCRNMHFPEPNADGVRLLGEPASQTCPVCAIPLQHAAAGGQRFLSCSQCRGILISMAAFVVLIDELRAEHNHSAAVMGPFSRRDLERRIRCPQCHEMMDTHPYLGPGHIVIDSCSTCYLNWLDYGELHRIVRAPDHTIDEAGLDQ